MNTIKIKLGTSPSRHHATNYIVDHPMIQGALLALIVDNAVNPLDLPGPGCSKAKVATVDEGKGQITIWRWCGHKNPVKLEPLVLPIIGKVVADVGDGYSDNYHDTIINEWLEAPK